LSIKNERVSSRQISHHLNTKEKKMKRRTVIKEKEES